MIFSEYGKYLGGGGVYYEEGSGIAVDGGGNVATTGYFEKRADFRQDPERFYLTSTGWTDIFVWRHGSGGNFLAAYRMGGESSDVGSAITDRSDTSIYTTGHFSRVADFALARYDEHGTPDEDFGKGGLLRTDFASRYDGATDLAVQSDGKIVVAGWAVINSSGETAFALTRYDGDGNLDSDFGEGGRVVVDFGPDTEARGVAVTIQPDQKIVVAGTVIHAEGENVNDLAMARLLPDGSLDASFRGDGLVITDVAGADDFASDVIIDGDGNIVLTGWTRVPAVEEAAETHADFVVVRYDEFGRPDARFAPGGLATTDFGVGTATFDRATAAALDGEGNIVVVGESGGDFALACYASSPATIRGCAFEDTDEDGEQDENEPGLARHTVYLDLDQDGLLGPDEPSVMTDDDNPNTPDTDETGTYRFTGLPAGTYTVAEAPRTGWRQTSPSEPVMDQFQLDGSAPVAPAIDSTVTLGQTFTVGQSGLLTGIELSLGEVGSFGDLLVEVLDLSGGDLATAPVLGSASVAETALGPNPVTLDPDAITATLVDLSKPRITVEAGDRLAVRLSSSRVFPYAYFVRMVTSDLYAGGTYFYGMKPDVDSDLAFKTFVSSPSGHTIPLAAGDDASGVDFGNLPQPRVVAERIFYNNSSFDGNDPAANEQDKNAIADKEALRPGRPATFANYTSYSRGINGIMVDIAGLPPVEGEVDAGDYFTFKVGNDDKPAGWKGAPEPLSVTVWPDQGVADSARFTLIWPDYAIRNSWLEVTVLANEYTGLTDPEVMYFGNAVGESGNSDTDAEVNNTDVTLARDNPHNFFNPAEVTCPYDYNRDARVNATDMLIARSNPTDKSTALKLIHLPALEGESAWAEESPVLASLRRDPAPAAASPSTSLGKWSWLCEFELMSTQSRPSEKHSPAAEAVDKLLATYWP